MSSGPPDRPTHAFGTRIAWWYGLVFLASSLALVGITYALLGAALRMHDREFVQSTLIQFAAAYTRGGPEALRREIQRVQISGVEGPLFVRTLTRAEEVVFVSMPEQWREFDPSQLRTPPLAGGQAWATLETGGERGHVLEVLSIRLADGTLFQVGKSTEHRSEILRRFRRLLFFALGAIVLIGGAGGAMLTHSALQPLRALADTIGSILRTGRTDARVPAQPPGDAFGDLVTLVNAMLDRIDAVVSGMRGALDNVAHDLRTPMARLRATAEEGLASGDSALLRTALAECVEEADRIMSMLNTLMDISEAETGTMVLRREKTELRRLLAQTVDLYEDLAEEAGIQLHTAVGEDLAVDADPNRLRQVLANLVDNAVKYTRSGGRIEITADRVESEARIRVSDTGTGIPAEEVPRVWERLYRGDKSRTTRGLGLGLSFVKAIVEAHGGRVALESTVGVGTTVEVRLPLSPSNLSPL
jgi:signal transduction histidine kinase